VLNARSDFLSLPVGYLLFLGCRWLRADPATDLAALLAFPLCKTLLAVEATFGDVFLHPMVVRPRG